MQKNRKYWLIKSEPNSWSWENQVKKGTKGEAWSGVRNHLAKKNLMSMKKGDLAFFYHSNIGKEIVGIVEVIKEHYPDPTAKPDEPWVAVDVKAVQPFKKPVTLAEIKSTKKLSHMSLVTSARLSVQPVTAEEWEIVCEMGDI